MSHLSPLHHGGQDSGDRVWGQSQLAVLGQREAGRVEVSRADVGGGSQRAFVPLGHFQPPLPQLTVFRKPAGQKKETSESLRHKPETLKNNKHVSKSPFVHL